MDNSLFTATHFDVKYLPDNKTAVVDITALSNIDANVTADVELIVYGLNVLKTNISFCSLNYETICPFSTGHLEISKAFELTNSQIDQIPSIAYTIPDLDARVRVVLVDSDSDETLACVEAILSNGKTVQTKYASWPIAAISGLGLITSGVVSVIGHSNTAAHIASNSMSLFIYFQSLAVTAMMAVAKVPPIAAAWAQNFQWSLGIIKLGFIQDIANWYVQATGGTSTDIIDVGYLSISVQKAKRSVSEFLLSSYDKTQLSNHLTLFKRFSLSIATDDFGQADSLDPDIYSTNEKADDLVSKILVLRGIQRVAYLAGIEITSLFLTSIIFLLFFGFVMVALLMAFKAVIEILIRSKMMNEGKFNEYRQQWGNIIKGALYRLLLVAFPQVAVMCLWELTTRDSAGTVVVAVFLFIVVFVLLCQAAVKVFLKGRRSVSQFKNPAYLLFGDGKFLNKFGFVYVQFRADAYFFVIVTLLYVFLKCLFVAVLQGQGKVQSVIIFAIELIHLVAVCYYRPFMDKRTNAFNITIAVISTINALFFMFFSYIFGQPQVVGSIMGIVYFILNAAFALFLLIFTIVTCVLALVYKNPDTRYQPMKDDRVSFIPRFDAKGGDNKAVQNEEDYELMALGATAMRGHENGGKAAAYDEEDSVYDEDSSGFGAQNRQNQVQFKTDDPKRNSLYTDNAEPTQPTSTITGNPGAAFTNFGNTAYQTNNNSSSSFNNPYQQRSGFNGYNQGYNTGGYSGRPTNANNVNFK
ncbi:flavin carrier protein 2 [[Candida] jaroonii]|uniref:Flavin carrier protein 2 n=1 Tax=[Candida] jaroonii TaxID=467808 RepID=A0ACA9YCU8_9ASCO|nr:flavin carrier protein 2 [[Candida] jaroonii]